MPTKTRPQHTAPGTIKRRGQGERAQAAIDHVNRKREAEERSMMQSFKSRPFVKDREALTLLQEALDEVAHEHDFWWDQVKHLTALQMTSRRYAPILAKVHSTRKEIEEVTSLMVKLGYEARRTVVEETQVTFFAAAVERALRENGITPAQRMAIGRTLKAIDVGVIDVAAS